MNKVCLRNDLKEEQINENLNDIIKEIYYWNNWYQRQLKIKWYEITQKQYQQEKYIWIIQNG